MNPFQIIKRKYLTFRINRALDIELLDWQISYIFDDDLIPDDIQRERRSGKTTAQILRLLMNPKYNNLTIGGESPESRQPGTHDYYIEAAKTARLYGYDGFTRWRRLRFLCDLRTTRRTLRRAKIRVNTLQINFV